jgi:hypothetical protein
MDLEFFQVAQDEYGLSSLLLQQRRAHGDEEGEGDEGDLVYLYALYFADEREESEDVKPLRV